MIPPSVLRIGNIIKSAHNDNIFTLESGEDIDILHDVCDPIPLTGEWLLKFGFHSIDKQHNLIWKKRKWIIMLPTKAYNSYRSIVNVSQPKSRHYYNIIYVHQLQNLYFALIGKELEIK